jgi:hypothetical protein
VARGMCSRGFQIQVSPVYYYGCLKHALDIERKDPILYASHFALAQSNMIPMSLHIFPTMTRISLDSYCSQRICGSAIFCS